MQPRDWTILVVAFLLCFFLVVLAFTQEEREQARYELNPALGRLLSAEPSALVVEDLLNHVSASARAEIVARLEERWLSPAREFAAQLVEDASRAKAELARESIRRIETATDEAKEGARR